VKKVWLNFVIDAAMFFSLTGIALMGLVIKYVLPPGSGGGGRGRGGLSHGAETFLGLNRHEWGSVHYSLALILLGLLVLHLLLHWSWIKCRLQALWPGKKALAECASEP
jgi:hypothetical protein